MTYLDYVVFFEKCDQQQPKGFSGNATRLYLKLLAIANGIANGGSWPAEFSKPDAYIAAVAGMSPNTMKECREQLVNGGLLAGSWGSAGRSSAGVYRLLDKPDNVSSSDSLPSVNVANSDTIESVNLSKSDTISPENGLNVSENVSKFDTLYKKEKEVVEEAASAAAPTALSEKPAEKPKRGAGKAKGATLEEVAALPSPFESAEFADTWRTFYTENPKQVQASKPLSAFMLMLKKLGKYPEAFAVVMLEKAIMGNWQGIENAGTARDFAEWQAQQRQQPQAAPPAEVLTEAPEMNPEFLRQQDEAAAAKRAARLAELATAA